MKNTSRHQAVALAASLMLMHTGTAYAVQFGIVPSAAPDAPAVVNPFTGKSTDAWKLVGTLGCSAVQISREWVASANHCGLPSDGAVFRSVLGQSATSGCTRLGEADIYICRLNTPQTLVAPSAYPALGVAPNVDEGTWFTGYVPKRESADKFGSLMVYGHAPSADGLVFTGYNGLPFGFDPALTPNTPPIPYTVGGDSGGGVFWFAPGASAAVIVGVLGVAATSSQSPRYFTSLSLDNIKAVISAKGDPIPPLLYSGQNFTNPGGNPAPELGTPPTASPSATGVVLTWSTPAGTPAVSSFDITVGKEGVLDRSVSVSVGAGNTLVLNNLDSRRYTACIRPRNSIGLSNAAYPVYSAPYGEAWYMTTYTPNCVGIDMRLPQATVSGLTGSNSGVSASTGLYKVTFAWAAPTPVPVDLAVVKYRLTQSIAYPSGPARNSTQDVGTTSAAVTTVKGAKVCVSVAGLTAMNKVGPKSSPVCVVAN